MPTLALRPLIESLDGQGLVREFSAWAGSLDDDPLRLWQECPRGDWLSWLLASVRAEPAALARAALECVRIAEVCVPTCEDAPRGVIVAVQGWLEGHLEAADCVAAGDAAGAVAAAGAEDFVRAAALSSFWLSRVVARAAGSPGFALDGGPSDAGTEARLSLWHAAAASALDVAQRAEPGQDWLERCLDAARRRCADVVREHVRFDALLDALPDCDAQPVPLPDAQVDAQTGGPDGGAGGA
jgi:hypothetical protein